MSSNNERYKLNGIPGFDTSEGEPGFYDAFRKLREYLKQVQLKQNQSNSNEEEMLRNQLRWLVLKTQIKYLRKIVRGGPPNEPSTTSASPIYLLQSLFEDEINVPLASTIADDKETQTGNSLIETLPENIDENKGVVMKHAEDTNSVVQAPTLNPLRSMNRKSNSRPHYHLNIDDVPFIVGQSTGASHSVVANVQKIISMMKQHNKNLCGPKPHQPTVNASNSETRPTENDRMIRMLRSDLSKLSMRQEQMEERFVNIQKQKSLPSNSKKANNEDNNARKSTSAMSNVLSKGEPKHAVPTFRKQHCVAASKPTMNKLMRSLRNCKSQLSQEDLSWE